MTATEPENQVPAKPCGCPEGEWAALNRRHLFRLAGVAGLVTATTLNNARVAFAATPTPTPSGSPSASPSGGASPSGMPSPSVKPTGKASPKPSGSPSATASASPTGSPSASASGSASGSASPSPSIDLGAPFPASYKDVGTEDVLVVVSLRGGMDGLSAVVPAGDRAYAAARPQIAVPAQTLHKVDSIFGLAPGLRPLYDLWDKGHVAAIHAVGQEAPTRSHFEAMEELERAAPESSLRSGWIDRSVGLLGVTSAFSAAQVGNPALPASLYGEHEKFALANLNDVKVAVDEGLVSISTWKRAVAALHKGAAPEVSRPTANAIDAVSRLKALPASTDPGQLGYPGGGLGAALHDVARLIKADLGVRFATVDYGNWDMHENLGGPEGGWMYDQLTELSQSLAAFARELGPDLGRVTVVTISEFGRRVEQNGSNGLDHGHGNVVLVMGGGVRGGKVYGRWPGLSASRLDQGDLAGTTDYRNVMAEILTQRCNLSGISTVFPGLKQQTLGFLRQR